jgi:ubiquinone/menaquinone biosynthesis C-methylase UbiE
MMNFLKYFSEQARKPSGLFGRIVMPIIFDRGNSLLNRFVYDLMVIKPDDQILEIGCGTGSLIKMMAEKIENGFIEGIDFSSEMVTIPKRKNKKHNARGKVDITEDHFDDHSCTRKSFSKACSVNTIYFWKKPEHVVKKVMNLMPPGGMFVVAFEDIQQLERRKLSRNVFRLYTEGEVIRLLARGGFRKSVRIDTRKRRNLLFHCAVATK